MTKLTYSNLDIIESDIIGELNANDLGILYYDWSTLIKNLEDFQNSVDKLPLIGSYITTAYDIDENTSVPQEWLVLGYNASIPEYVKYKNCNLKIWVRTLKNDLLTNINVGDTIYINDNGKYVATSNVVSSIIGNFTYGNNCTYVVPMQIVANGKIYDFAGYNITLLSKLALSVKHENILYTFALFDSHRNKETGQNDWSTSMLRLWMNGIGDMNRLLDLIWQDSNWNYLTYGSTILPLINRYLDDAFFKNIQNTVNRIWIHPSFRSGKTLNNEIQYVSDKFWLLNTGNINISGTNTDKCFSDQNYCTSIFSDIFTPNNDVLTYSQSRVRYCMDIDGNANVPCLWWLLSANTIYDNNVGYVCSDGYVYTYNAYYDFGIIPACTLG